MNKVGPVSMPDANDVRRTKYMAKIKLLRYCFCKASNIPFSYKHLQSGYDRISVCMRSWTHEVVEELVCFFRETPCNSHDLEATDITTAAI